MSEKPKITLTPEQVAAIVRCSKCRLRITRDPEGMPVALRADDGSLIGTVRSRLELVLCDVHVPALPSTPPPPRTCNRHDDCDAADAAGKAAGRFDADHCHDETCEDCFGS